jgi:hypothetical protein
MMRIPVSPPKEIQRHPRKSNELAETQVNAAFSSFCVLFSELSGALFQNYLRNDGSLGTCGELGTAKMNTYG